MTTKDISAEVANSYIVSEPETNYLIDATRKSDGSLLATSYVDVVWQTASGFVQYADFEDGKASFYIGADSDDATKIKQGNAVIGAYNADDELIWSWHIWVTAADLDAAVQTYTLYDNFAAAGPTVLMDRNLGALKAGMWGTNGDNLALGLLYQWGRKDPFLNIDDTDIGGTGALAIGRLRKTYDAAGNALSVDNAAAEYDATNWRYFTAKTIPADRIARYPMNFGYLSTSNNWLDEARDDLWGNPFSGEVGETGHKSVYDPCPPGYRVPHRYIGTMFTTDGKNASNKNAADLARWKGQYTTQAEIQGAGGNIYPYGGGSASYPLGGMLFVSGGKIVPFRTGKYVGAYHVSMPANNVKTSYRFYFDYGNIKPEDSNARYVGASIRCMKEQ